VSKSQRETERQRPKRKKLRKALTAFVLAVLAFLGIFVTCRSFYGKLLFTGQRRFTECDPDKVMSLINRSFDFALPNNISSAQAAETRTSWLDPSYIFILRFTTDYKGWEDFHTSFPKHDVYDFMDFDPDSDDPRIEPWWGWPKWFKEKIGRGKYYLGRQESKDHRLRTRTICVDLADPEKVIVYIDGWGDYDSSYGLD
jgi:hypothetical protein